MVVAAMRVPRHAWEANWLFLSLLGCALGALWAVELFGLDGPAALWTVVLAGVLFVGVVLVGAARIFRRRYRAPSAR